MIVKTNRKREVVKKIAHHRIKMRKKLEEMNVPTFKCTSFAAIITVLFIPLAFACCALVWFVGFKVISTILFYF